jgi:hypothetical protein
MNRVTIFTIRIRIGHTDLELEDPLNLSSIETPCSSTTTQKHQRIAGRTNFDGEGGGDADAMETFELDGGVGDFELDGGAGDFERDGDSIDLNAMKIVVDSVQGNEIRKDENKLRKIKLKGKRNKKRWKKMEQNENWKKEAR